MSYLLSIVVPEKDRYKYLKPLIELIRGFSLDDLELVIQDNTIDNAEILEFIDSISYPHLKYYHHKEKLSVVQNANKGVLNSTGEYVCMIGDDDGIVRNIIECVKWMKMNDVEALRPRHSTFYLWPDAVINSSNKQSSLLSYQDTKPTFQYINPIEEVKRLGGIGMQNIGLLPKVYHGIVKRSILDKVYNIGETYFPGAAGDMANAVALSFCVKKFVIVDFPVTIHGSSQMTGGGIVRKKNEMAKLDEVDFITQEVVDNWETTIPRIWHTCFVWPESATKGLRYMSQVNLIQNINYDYMLAHFISRVGLSYINLCSPFIKSKIGVIKIYTKFKFISILVKLKALLALITFWDKRLLYSVKRVHNVDDIILAEKTLFEKTGPINYSGIKEIHS